MTKFQLMAALFADTTDGRVTIQSYRGESVTGYLVSVLREDGSGSSFLVHMRVGGIGRDVYVRTID